MDADFRDSLPGDEEKGTVFYIRLMCGEDRATVSLDDGEIEIGSIFGEKVIGMLTRACGEALSKSNRDAIAADKGLGF